MYGFQISKKGMENKMDGKSYVLENIIQNYRIKDGEKVTTLDNNDKKITLEYK